MEKQVYLNTENKKKNPSKKQLIDSNSFKSMEWTEHWTNGKKEFNSSDWQIHLNQ